MKNLSKLLAVLLLVFSSQACTEVLEDVEPTTAITPEVAFQDAGSVQAFRTQLYSRMHGFLFTTRMMIAPESFGDNAYNRIGSSRFQGYSQNQLLTGMMDGSYDDVYNLIQDANVVISAIPDGVIDADEKTQYQAEALFFRAFAMHYAVKSFGYEPNASPATGSGAGFDLGIIIRTEPVLGLTDADFRPRNTVADVYTQIRTDLQDALDLFATIPAVTNRNFVTPAAVNALLARVELYAGNYPAAATAATNAINGTSGSLATTAADVADMFDETAFSTNPESIFEIAINPATESQGINSSLNAYTSDQWIAQIPTPSLLALYEAADFRNAWYGPCFNSQNGAPETGCNNGDFMSLKWNGELGQFTDNVPIFRVSEMYLIQAEAYLNGAPGGTAAGALNTLLTARNATNIAAPTLDDILDERRRELALEGHRFFDLKRLQRDIIKDPIVGSGDVLFGDRRFLDDIDIDELQDNPELVQNPGYQAN